jgi:hypothetical protein
MPTVRDVPGPYRFFFYSFDCNEPKHVHVERDRSICKFWLDPLVLARNHGFAPHELNQIRGLIKSHMRRISDAWDQHCGQA